MNKDIKNGEALSTCAMQEWIDRLELKEVQNSVPSEALDDIEEIIQELYERKVYGFTKKFVRIRHVVMKAQKLEIENARYKQLEEQLGCPLEVRCKITTDTTIYDVEGNSFEVSYIHDNNFTAIMNCGFGSNYEFDFKYSDYRKTWFLREDKSE